MQSDFDEETFESTFPEQTYSIELTDASIAELIPNGNAEKVLYEDRFKFIEMAMKVRLAESDVQVASLKKGLCKIIPYSVIKLYERLSIFIVILFYNSVNIKLTPTSVIWLRSRLSFFNLL